MRSGNDAGQEGLARNLFQFTPMVLDGVEGRAHSTMSLWTLLCALGHIHAAIVKGLPQTIPTKLEA